MKLTILYFCVLTCTALTSVAQDKSQSVISTAGDVSKSSTMILEWTVGEPAIETLQSSTALLTQGFHQPVLKIQQKDVARAVKNSSNPALIYPNPATALVTIQMQKPLERSLQVLISDASGKVLLRNNFPQKSNAVKINLANLSQGTYLLQLVEADGSIQSSYQVIKVQ